MLKVSTRTVDDIVVVHLDGQMAGGPESEEFHRHVREAVAGGTRKVLLNLEDLQWMNSLGLGVLISSFVTAKRDGALVRLCGPQPRVLSVLKTSGVVPEVFDLCESEAAGIESFR